MKHFHITILLSLLMSVAATNTYATEDVEIAISSDTQVRVYCSGEYGGGEIMMPFSWSSIIHKSIVALGGGLTQEEFESGWIFDGTQYSAKDVLKTNPIGNVYYAPEISEEGVVWFVDDNTILNLAYQGKVDPKTGVSTEAISTMVKLEGSPNVWVTLTIPAGSFQFAVGKIYAGKKPSCWFDLNSAANGEKEIHANVTVPNTQNDDCSFNFDIMSTFDGIYHAPDIYWFDRFNDEATTSFRFTSPSIAKGNATFDADNNGQWTVMGASGQTYTLRVSTNGLRIETASDIPIVRLTGNQNNIAEYQSNAIALDILNYANHTQLDSRETFTAYVEIVVESCYEMTITDNSQFFNVRFLRPVDLMENGGDVICDEGDIYITNVMDLVSLSDWRGIDFTSTNAIIDNDGSLDDVMYITYDMPHYINYYGVVITADVANAYTDVDGMDFELTYTHAPITWNGNNLEGGILMYKSNSKPSQDFNIFIPLTFSYKWGNNIQHVIGVISVMAPLQYELKILSVSNYLDEVHLYDENGNEYDVTDFSSNEFDAGSYIRISPFIPASLYISEIIVNGESVGTWTDENNSPTDYVIENLSENTTVEFKTYYREQIRTLTCIANGPGNVEMYKNDVYVGATTDNNEPRYFSEVFDEGDVLKLIFVPEAGSRLTQFLGGDMGAVEALTTDLLGLVTDNTYTLTFNIDDIVNQYDRLLRCFSATFEGPEPQTDNFLSATSTTILKGNSAELIIGLTNEDEIIMTEFYMQLPEGITIEEDEDGYPIVTLNSERENKHVIEVNRNSEGLYHFLCYSSKNNAFKGNEGELFNMNLICAEGVTAGTYTATVKDIIMSDVDRNELTQSDFTFDITVLDVAMGDANGDGRINGMDIVEMVDYIMERPSNSFVFAAADLTGDGKVNGMDLVELVSLVMAQGATQAAPPSVLPRREGTLQTEELDEGTLTLKGNENGGLMLGVENSDEFILAQMVVEVSDGTLTDITTDAKHDAVWSQIGVGRYAVLAYSTRNRSFTTNDCLLTFLGCEGNVTVKDVMLVDADREAKFFADVTYNGTTGIEPIPNSSLKGSESIYDLSGRKLETRNMELGTSPKGVYIVNGKKVVVK